MLMDEKPSVRVALKWLSLAAALALLAAVIPLFMASVYNRPYYDDFALGGRLTREAMAGGGSAGELLSAAFTSARISYMRWEGNYVSNFLNGMQLSAISTGLVPAVTWILVLGLLLSDLCLCHVLFRKALKGGWPLALTAFCALSFPQIVFVPSCGEAFFWQSGGFKYTLGYAFTAMTAALALRVTLRGAKPPHWALTALLCVFSLLSAGANLMSGMLVVCGLSLYAAFLAIKRREGRRRALTGAAFAIAGYLINLLAPGNAVRESMASTTGPLMTVMRSFFEAAEYAGRYTTLPLISIFLLLSPFVYEAVKGADFKFRRPGTVVLISLCVFASQFAPPIYAGVYLAEGGRLLNTIYFTFIMTALFDLVYVLGFISRRKRGAAFVSARRGVALAFVIAALSGIVAGTLGYGVKKTSTGGAAHALLSGQAARYSRAYGERLALLENPELRSVEVSPIEDVPLIFMNEDFAWNAIVPLFAEYYGKEVTSARRGDS